MNIFLTGYTGNLGAAIAERLTPHTVLALVRPGAAAPEPWHVRFVEGSLENLAHGIQAEINIIIHAAADTSFTAPLETLRATNVAGTANLLAFAAKCPRLQKFVHVSTACVCGTRGGLVPEEPLPWPPGFVNNYERSKWKAEDLVLASGLPAEVVRLSIVAGSEVDGSVKRPGALHHALYWFYKGLIPMMPGNEAAPVDLISTEFAADVVAASALSAATSRKVIHGCAGDVSPRLGELLDQLAAVFSEQSDAWRHGRIARPMIVDSETFGLFERSVEQSGDALFTRVCRDAKAFLPGLLHPRHYLTSTRPDPGDWRSLTTLVTRHVLASRS